MPNGPSPGSERFRTTDADRKPVLARSRYDSETRAKFDKVAAAIRAHEGELRAIPDVIDVRPGYPFRNGKVRREPAVVVKVLRKKPESNVPPDQRIPRSLDGVPVDVAPATPVEQLRAEGQADAELLSDQTTPSDESTDDLALPDWDRGLAPEAEADVEGGLLDAERLFEYEPPSKLALEAVTDAMRVTCHVSPDAGWPTLRGFLEGVRKSLTIAMYNFTAPHIRDSLVGAMEDAPGKLRLNLDGNASKYKDLTEDDVRDSLEAALGERFEFTWAGVYRKRKTTGGYFPSAYHIKVASRDRKAFWLSSGNWEPSNQDDVDPLGLSAGESTSLLRKRNREWHVIVEHGGLARLYDDFIRYDIEKARPLQAGRDEGSQDDDETLSLPPLAVEDENTLLAPPAKRFYPPKAFTFTKQKPLKVQPLLTPDNYGRHVLALIESAEQRIYFQNQSFAIAKTNPALYTRLWETLLEKSRALEVRIIVRDYRGDAREKIETLVDKGFDPDILKSQVQCHTKGLIVDSKVVMVGSHNWTGQGTVLNRDASLIFWDEGIAKYFEEIFEHDWEHLAKYEPVGERDMPVIVTAEDDDAGGLLGGGVVVPWQTVFND
jgi:hypothetical protein